MKLRLLMIVLLLLVKTGVAADPKLDVEELLNDMLPFGQEMLEEHGEFIPYGAAIKINGEIVSVAGGVGVDQPKSQEVINSLKDAFRLAAMQGKYKVTAIFYDVSTVDPASGQKTDAIAVALDHVDGLSLAVFLPYELAGSRVVFGETFVRRGANDIFVR